MHLGQQTMYLKMLGSSTDPIALTSFFTIGSSSENSLSLSSKHISQRHCRLEQNSQGYLLRDLRSQTGTFVNNTQVLEAVLRLGDIIRIGEYSFHFLDSPTLKMTKSLRSKNPFYRRQLEKVDRIAAVPFPVLVEGPSGSGKELLSQSLHELSSRSKAPYITVNCSAINESLVESELFGHTKGSFTDATSDRRGAFEAARGGTLFLDEIGDLPLTLQPKLLLALENSEIRPVGSDRTIKTDVRVVAATHHNLREKVMRGEFREDLFYRLNVLHFKIPALKDRMEDFDDVFMSFCKHYQIGFTFNAAQKLKDHDWPGNIRELKNLVARASTFFRGRKVTEDDLSQLIERRHYQPYTSNQVASSQPSTPMSLRQRTIKEVEKGMIVESLLQNGGNQRRTADQLGMPKSTLHDRIKSYGINIKQLLLDAQYN